MHPASHAVTLSPCLDAAKNDSPLLSRSPHGSQPLITGSSLIKSWKIPPGCIQYRDILCLSAGKSHSYTTHQVQTYSGIVLYYDNWL